MVKKPEAYLPFTAICYGAGESSEGVFTEEGFCDEYCYPDNSTRFFSRGQSPETHVDEIEQIFGKDTIRRWARQMRAKCDFEDRPSWFHERAYECIGGGGDFCPNCRTSLGRLAWWKGNREKPSWGDGISIQTCTRCAWWYAGYRFQESCKFSFSGAAAARFRRFPSPIPEGCNAELASYLCAHPSCLQTYSSTRLELLVADVFRANHRAVEVIHMGKRGDRGTDIYYVDCDGCDWLIQVKGHRNRGRTEGFETIQALAGTLLIEGKLRGILVTTAVRFTKGVMETAENLRLERGRLIELVDRGKLLKMVSTLTPRYPWEECLSGHFYDPEYQYLLPPKEELFAALRAQRDALDVGRRE